MSLRSGLPLLVCAGLLWGTGGVLGTSFGRSADLSSTAVAACRLGFGGLLLLVVAGGTGGGVPRDRLAWRRIAVVGVLAAVFQGAYFAATAVAGVAVATLLTIGSAPIVVVIVEAARARERPSAVSVRTVAVGITGLALLVGSPTGGDVSDTIVGGAFAVVSGVAFAMITLVGRRPVKGLSDTAMTAWSFVVGGALLAAVAAVAQPSGRVPEVSATSLGLLAALAIVPTAVAYTAYFRGLRTAAASTAAVVALLEPLTGTVLAVLLLDESLTLVGILGAVLLLLSVVDAGIGHVRREKVVPHA